MKIKDLKALIKDIDDELKVILCVDCDYAAYTEYLVDGELGKRTEDGTCVSLEFCDSDNDKDLLVFELYGFQGADEDGE